MKHFSHSSYLFVAASLLMALVIASCGGGGSSATAIPTSTQIPTYNYVLPTSTVGAATAAPTSAAESTGEAAATSEAASTSEAAATSEATAVAAANVVLDQEVVAKGKGRYDALACASCHGENGVGTDKGPALTTSTLNEGDFIAFMRSGGKLGAEHQFSTNRLSISGGTALYQYILSLRTAK